MKDDDEDQKYRELVRELVKELRPYVLTDYKSGMDVAKKVDLIETAAVVAKTGRLPGSNGSQSMLPLHLMTGEPETLAVRMMRSLRV